MSQLARRTGHLQVARRRALLRENIQAISQAKKEELLVAAGIRDYATGGDILQTAIEYRDDNVNTRTRANDPRWGRSRAERLIRDALSYLGRGDRDELLLEAGLRNGATADDIFQAAIDARGEVIVVEDDEDNEGGGNEQ
ncbi:hypothetical protein F4824DRAFT_497379 [Ustulina deusta]|nr:hypothetical protein F4824DRAFT_497379 [Ustulina deusta]